jgi:hypothetical protein
MHTLHFCFVLMLAPIIEPLEQLLDAEAADACSMCVISYQNQL